MSKVSVDLAAALELANECVEDQCHLIEDLAAENKVLKAGLSFYGDLSHWSHKFERVGYECRQPRRPITEDGGELARDLLEEFNGK